MRLAVSGPIDDEFLAYARQVGATDYIGGGHDMPTDHGYYRFQDMMLMRQRIEDAGLRWAVLDGIPAEWKYQIKLGLPGRDEQIENWRRTLENMGAAGVPALGYFFSPRSSIGHYGLRTSRSTPGRGGAKVTSFDWELIQGADQGFWDPPVDRSLEVTEDDVWAAAAYFLEAVVPAAEDAGVRMGMHPDDPPMSPIGGVARVFRSHEALRRLIELVPSPSNCVGFCQGTISEMPGDVYDAIRYFGSRNRIVYVHFRNVTGRVPSFSETFIDEGYVDMLKAMRTYKEAGYDGPFIDDHVPVMVGGERQYPSHAFAMGYMRGLLHAVNAG